MRLIRGNGAVWKTASVVALSLAASGSISAKSDLVVHDPGALPALVAAPAPRIGRRVLVSLADRKLAVLKNGRVLRIFEVAVGADLTPSPTGKFSIAHRLANPTYYHPGVIIPPGKDNPLGPRWVGLTQKGFGIHGTNQPESIGRAASHGCIRMRNRDVKAFFEMVSVGDVVEIGAKRDEQMARIFGPPTITLASAAAAATGE
jgi:lipoprotein-anchoring transpeptidase ErfK/SrfK